MRQWKLTVQARGEAAGAHRPGSKAASYGCPLRLGTVTAGAVLTQKTNFKDKKRPRQRPNPANRPEPGAHRGVLWGAISDREWHGDKRKKAKRMGSARWPRVYRLRQAWRSFPALWGSPALPFLMNVNEDGGDFR